MKKYIEHFLINPNQLYLVDCLGAFLSAISLFVFSKFLNSYFGMPEGVLLNLSFIAIGLFFISFLCFIFVRSKRFLGIIGIANGLYSILTSYLLLSNFQSLTLLGLGYIALEVIILIYLSTLEIRVFLSKN